MFEFSITKSKEKSKQSWLKGKIQVNKSALQMGQIFDYNVTIITVLKI
jgi:hypothetical protein